MVLAGVFYLNSKSFSDCGDAIPPRAGNFKLKRLWLGGLDSLDWENASV